MVSKGRRDLRAHHLLAETLPWALTQQYPWIRTVEELRGYFGTDKITCDHMHDPGSITPFQRVAQILEMMKDLSVEDRHLLTSGIRTAKERPPGHSATIELPGRQTVHWLGDIKARL